MHRLLNRKFLLSAIGTALVIAATIQFLPNQYEAETLIMVQPARIPESYFHTTVTSDVVSRIGIIQMMVLSDTRLQRIIDTYDLYKPMRKRYTMPEAVAKMRNDIKVTMVHAAPDDLKTPAVGFRITFRYTQPALTAQVANQLASLFIEENLKIREQEAEGTSEFIDTRLDLAKKSLEEQEARERTAPKSVDRIAINRDIELLRTLYTTLLQKKLDADIAADMEKRQKSERFTIVDPARIPEKPLRFAVAGW